MKKVALLAALSAALVASVAQAATPSGPGKPTVTLHFFDLTTSGSATISGHQRPKLGDRFFSHDNVYLWKGGKRGAPSSATPTRPLLCWPRTSAKSQASPRSPAGRWRSKGRLTSQGARARFRSSVGLAAT